MASAALATVSQESFKERRIVSTAWRVAVEDARREVARPGQRLGVNGGEGIRG